MMGNLNNEDKEVLRDILGGMKRSMSDGYRGIAEGKTFDDLMYESRLEPAKKGRGDAEKESKRKR